MSNPVKLVICTVEPADPFVCEVYGKITTQELIGIEDNLRLDPPDWYIDLPEGVWTLDITAQWIKGDLEIPGYWYFDKVEKVAGDGYCYECYRELNEEGKCCMVIRDEGGEYRHLTEDEIAEIFLQGDINTRDQLRGPSSWYKDPNNIFYKLLHDPLPKE